MDILPSEEEQMLKNVAREVLEAEVSTAMVREMELDDLGYSTDLWRRMASLAGWGWPSPRPTAARTAPDLPGSDYGGVGPGAGPVPLHSTMVAALTIAEAGREEQRREIPPCGLRRRHGLDLGRHRARPAARS